MKTMCIIILGTIVMPMTANAGPADDYRSQLKEKLYVSFSVPDDHMRFHSELPTFVLTFGESLPELPGGPIFEAGPVVSLSKDYSAVIMDADHLQKPRVESYPDHWTYTPTATSWMLINCSTPWAGWYINNVRGVITDNPAPARSDAEIASLKEKVASLRSQYERSIEGGALVEKSNCDRIYITKIPHLDKVENMFSPAIVKTLRSGMTECYAVEFFKRSVYGSLVMVLFVDSARKSIDDCIAELAEFIRFDSSLQKNLSVEETQHIIQDMTAKVIYADSIFGGDYLKLRNRQGDPLSYGELRSLEHVSLKESPIYVFDSLTFVNAVNHPDDRELIDAAIQSLLPTDEMVSCFLCYDNHAVAHAVYKKKNTTWACIETMGPIDLFGDTFDKNWLSRPDFRVIMYPLVRPAWWRSFNLSQPWRGYISYMNTYNFAIQNQDGTLDTPNNMNQQGNIITESLANILYLKLNPVVLRLE